jgi:ABC-type sugar transport system ATPase subunit
MENEKILSLKNITKKFGALVALDDVSVDLYKNEVMALVGDNGAGKSTLIKVISGAHLPDKGEIYLNGKEVTFSNPMEAKRAGIETVYQDLALVDTLNVAQNLFLGREEQISLMGGAINFLRHRYMEQKSKVILDTLGIDIPNPREKLGHLSGGQRQSVAVAKATNFGENIVILDEPTAALAVKEVGHILDLVKRCKNRGISIIIITHNLEHAFMVADRFVVLRVGKKVGERLIEETNVDDIVKLITGGTFIKEGKVGDIELKKY